MYLKKKNQLCLKECMSLLKASAISFIRELYFETTKENIYFNIAKRSPCKQPHIRGYIRYVPY